MYRLRSGEIVQSQEALSQANEVFEIRYSTHSDTSGTPSGSCGKLPRGARRYTKGVW